MKLFVPRCMQKLTLRQDWTFTLFFETRNEKFINFLKPGTIDGWDYDEDQSIQTTLPKGTVLRVERVYIRNGDAGRFNSLTFMALSPGKKTGHRFWVKLDDVNQIDIEPVKEK